MSPRLTAFSTGLAQLGCLAGIVITATLFSQQSQRPFEGEKILLFQAISALTASGIIGVLFGVWRTDGYHELRQRVASPVVPVACVYWAVLTLATILSISPTLSFWGTYERLQGLRTEACYAIAFLAGVTVFRARTDRATMVDALILSSVPAIAYAILQRLGFDPLDWLVRTSQDRIESTFGNGIYLGAFMATVLPLTSARCVAAYTDRATSLRTVALATLAALQAGTVVLAWSRGPWLASAAMAFSAAVLVAGLAGRRTVSRLLVALATLAAVIALGAAAAAPERAEDWLQSGSTAVRLRTLQGAAAAIADAPGWRQALGSGPETFGEVFQTYRPADLGLLQPRAYPNRAHNAVFDHLVATGVVGSLAYAALLIACIATALGQLGFRAGRIARASGLGGAIAVLTTAALTGLPGVGFAAPVGILLGALAGVATSNRAQVPWSDDHTLALGVALALITRLVEGATGLPFAAGTLTFWLLAGIAAAAPAAQESGGGAAAPVDWTWATVTGTALVLIVFSFYSAPLRTVEVQPAVLTVGIGTLLFALLLRNDVPSRTAVLVATAIGLGFALYFSPIADDTYRHDIAHAAAAAGDDRERAPSALYHPILALLILGSGAIAFAQRASKSPDWPAVAVLVIPLGIAGLAVHAVRAEAVADRLAHYTGGFTRRGQWDSVIMLRERALRYAPTEPVHLRQLVAGLRRKGPSASDGPRAQEALLAVLARQPTSVDARVELARFLIGLALRGHEDADHVAAAGELYEESIRLRPNDPLLRAEWAETNRVLGRTRRALAIIASATEIDTRYARAHVVHGKVLEAMGHTAEAQQAYSRALAGSQGRHYGVLDKRQQADALERRAGLNARLGDTTRAIKDYRRAIKKGSPNQDEIYRKIAELERHAR